jgi:hypothetical protein
MVAPVAQWIEQQLSNLSVAGSNPAGGTDLCAWPTACDLWNLGMTREEYDAE